MASQKWWSVEVGIRHTGGSSDEAKIDDLVEELVAYSGVVGVPDEHESGVLNARLAVKASTLEAAIHAAVGIFRTALSKAGINARAPIVHAEATEWELFEEELDRPNAPRFAGAAEVTKVLGVSKQRLAELRLKALFPDPVCELAAGPVWDLSAIESFLERWPRRPGRPRADAEVAGLHHVSDLSVRDYFVQALRGPQGSRSKVRRLPGSPRKNTDVR